MLDPYTESVLIFTGINIVVALGLYLPVSAGLLSLGQGGFMAIGAYTAAYLTTELQWPFFVALLCGGLIGAQDSHHVVDIGRQAGSLSQKVEYPELARHPGIVHLEVRQMVDDAVGPSELPVVDLHCDERRGERLRRGADGEDGVGVDGLGAAETPPCIRTAFPFREDLPAASGAAGAGLCAESRERQYALGDYATVLGWPRERVRV